MLRDVSGCFHKKLYKRKQLTAVNCALFRPDETQRASINARRAIRERDERDVTRQYQNGTRQATKQRDDAETTQCLEISQRNMASLIFFARLYYCILNGGRTWPLCLFRVICLRVSRHLACRSLNLQVGTFAATSAMQQKLYALHARFLTHRTLSSLWCDRGFVVSRLCSSDIVAPSRCALTGLVFCWSHRFASACLSSIPSRCMVPCLVMDRRAASCSAFFALSYFLRPSARFGVVSFRVGSSFDVGSLHLASSRHRLVVLWLVSSRFDVVSLRLVRLVSLVARLCWLVASRLA